VEGLVESGKQVATGGLSVQQHMGLLLMGPPGSGELMHMLRATLRALAVVLV
jgi:hypothetical protein